MKNGNWIFWVIGLGSLLLMGFTLYYNYTYATNLACDQQGIFGDMFGASNAFFTGLSFTGVIIAILLQRQELKLQRNELELTRKEMELTREEFVSQNYTMKLQQFENTFFQMLNMFYENKDRLSYMTTSHYQGVHVFRAYVNDIRAKITSKVQDHLNVEISRRESNDPTVDKEIVEMTLDQIIPFVKEIDSLYTDSIYLYRLSLIALLKLIDKTILDDKQFYISLIKSHLGNKELLFIFFSCLISDSDSELYNLVIKFKILDKLGAENLISNSLKNELIQYQ